MKLTRLQKLEKILRELCLGENEGIGDEDYSYEIDEAIRKILRWVDELIGEDEETRIDEVSPADIRNELRQKQRSRLTRKIMRDGKS